MTETRSFEDQLAVLLEQARAEAATIEELIAMVTNGTELFRRFWGALDHQDKTVDAWRAWFLERRPYMRERLLTQSVPAGTSYIRPPEPPADLNDRTATLADQLEAIRAGRVN